MRPEFLDDSLEGICMQSRVGEVYALQGEVRGSQGVVVACKAVGIDYLLHVVSGERWLGFSGALCGDKCTG